MAFRLEGKDIVISGFEQGIADTPYQGIADMRNIEIISVPNEASVGFKTIAASVPPVMNAVAYTAQASADTLTVSSTTGLYAGCAIVLASNTATGLSNSIVYYVRNITATTFKVYVDPEMGTPVNITADGSGTLTTYQYGNQRGISSNRKCPQSYFTFYDNFDGLADVENSIFLVDASNYLWMITEGNGSIADNSLIFMGNIGGIGASSNTCAVAVWKGWILLFDDSGNIDIAQIQDLIQDGPAIEWSYAWQTTANTQTNEVPQLIVSQNDGNLYFTSATGLGSLLEVDGTTFNPTNSATYSFTSDALSLPTNDRSTCMCELGDNVYVGGTLNYVYPWNRQNLGFNPPLFVPDRYTSRLLGTDQNLFIFAGNRGRIYISNTASVDLYKKIPDYVTGIVNPYITWDDVSYARNQILFSFHAWDNDGTLQTTVAGVWAIDIESKALRLLNKITNSGYSGIVSMITEFNPAQPVSTTPQTFIEPLGNGIWVGWHILGTTTYGVDKPDNEPYQSYESYIETDMIPVGTFLKPLNPSQIEWKTSYPLGGNGTAETIKISYRTNLLDAYTQIGTTVATGTSVVGTTTGTTTGAYAVSDYYQTNFQKAQWVQFKVEMSSNATTPTYCRLYELRLRDYPSQK